MKNNTFIAETFKRELKKGHFIHPETDHIARYGKGFSNLLQMAATPQPDHTYNSANSSRHASPDGTKHTMENDADSIMTPNGGEDHDDMM